MKVTAIIPCRYKSTRLEGKPLAMIGDKPMLWHVYQRASLASSLDEIHIATDDERIAAACEQYALSYLMTSPAHATGTDRVAECAAMLDADVIVNVQGDEPFIEPASIDTVAHALLNGGDDVGVSNAYTRLTDDALIHDPGVVKVVFSASGRAMAYSRLPIPLAFREPASHYRQLGLYAFRREALQFFAATPQGPLELSESVELFRFIEHDRNVLMVEVTESGIAVDTPDDLRKAVEFYQRMKDEG